MYYILNRNYALRGWDRLPYAIINKEHQLQFLKKGEFDSLMLANGLIDVDFFLVPDECRTILREMEKHGLCSRCEYGETLDDWQQYKMYPARYIQSAHWSITGKCNYRCKHCYMSAPDAKFGEMSFEVCSDIIDQLFECGIMNISLTGGEPLLRKDFFELLDKMLSYGMNITTIYTNGSLITAELLDQFERRGIKPEFNLSFDGIGWHDWLRGISGAEDRAKSAFALCQNRGFPTGAEMCLHKKNAHTLRDTINLLASLGVGHLKTNPASLVGDWIENEGGDLLEIKELYDIYLTYIPAFFQDGAPMNLMLGGFFAGRKGSKEYFCPAERFQGGLEVNEKYICGHARRNMYIAPNGTLLPCMALSGMTIQEKFPSLAEQRLSECLTNSFYMDFIDTRVEDYLAHNPDCEACEHKYVCGGGCRASATAKRMELFDPDPEFCFFFKNSYKAKIIAAVEAVNNK